MKTAKKQEAPSSRMSGLTLIALGALILPIFALLPFAIHAKTNDFSVGTRLLGWTAKGPIESAPTVWINWDRPGAIQTISIIGVIAFALLAALTMWFAAKHSNYRNLKKLSTTHLLVAIAVVLVTTTSYTILRRSSQSQPILVRSSQVYGITNPEGSVSCQEITIVSHNGFTDTSKPCSGASHVPSQRLGFGITPAYLVLFSALYLVAPLLNWYRYRVSSRYVGAQKKDTLFQ